MCGMKNEIDDTQPLKIPPQAGINSDLENTKATPITQTPEGDSEDLAQTMPTAVENEPEVNPQDPIGFSDTVSTPISQETDVHIPASDLPKEKKREKKRFSWLISGIIGLVALILIAAISAFAGYGSGISLRQNAESTQVAQVADEQFQLGVQEMAEGQYFRARQRFEYVIQLNPNYPGVTEKLADVLLELNTTATPTLVPTPTLTPTPDMRGIQELIDQSNQYIANSDWSNAIDALLMLRKTDPEYKPVEVDGLLFLALRNRGKEKIVNEADLEGGIYDLTLASRFGPMDSEAQGLLNWSTMYITGASFWDIDWEQVLFYFEQVAPQMPHLRDGSGWTAAERYRVALFEYGNSLARQGKYCKAVNYYQQSLSYGPDPQVEEAYNVAAKGCNQQSGEKENKETPEAGN